MYMPITCIDPTHHSYILDPTSEDQFLRLALPSGLLIKEIVLFSKIGKIKRNKMEYRTNLTKKYIHLETNQTIG